MGAEGSGGGAGSSGRGVVLEERQNAARESRGASSCSPSPNLLLLPKCPCRAQGHSGTPHVGACCAGRPGRCCASASRRRKLDPGSRFVSRATGRAHAPMREDLPVRRRGLVLGAGGCACQAESASGSGHRVPNHSLNSCVAVFLSFEQKCSRLARRPRSCGCGRWSTSTTSSAPSTSASGSKSFP